MTDTVTTPEITGAHLIAGTERPPSDPARHIRSARTDNTIHSRSEW